MLVLLSLNSRVAGQSVSLLDVYSYSVMSLQSMFVSVGFRTLVYSWTRQQNTGTRKQWNPSWFPMPWFHVLVVILFPVDTRLCVIYRYTGDSFCLFLFCFLFCFSLPQERKGESSRVQCYGNEV